MLIKAFGSYWNPDIVDWGKKGPGNRGKLAGKAKIQGRSTDVDLWNAHALYVLSDEFRCVYVGQAFDRPLGPRLRDHLTDRFAGRWDMFSWFSISNITRKGNLSNPGTRQVGPAMVMDTLEALAILIADPALNRKRESIPSGLEVIQAKTPHPKTIRHYLERILAQIESE